MDRNTHRSLSQPQLGGACQYGCVCVCVCTADSTTAEESNQAFDTTDIQTGRQTGRRGRQVPSNSTPQFVLSYFLSFFLSEGSAALWLPRNAPSPASPCRGPPLHGGPETNYKLEHADLCGRKADRQTSCRHDIPR